MRVTPSSPEAAPRRRRLPAEARQSEIVRVALELAHALRTGGA